MPGGFGGGMAPYMMYGGGGYGHPGFGQQQQALPSGDQVWESLKFSVYNISPSNKHSVKAFDQECTSANRSSNKSAYI